MDITENAKETTRALNQVMNEAWTQSRLHLPTNLRYTACMIQVIEILKARKEARQSAPKAPKGDPQAVLNKEKMDQEIGAQYGVTAKELQWLGDLARVMSDKQVEMSNTNFAREIENNIRELRSNPVHGETVSMLETLKQKVQKWQ